MGVRFNAMGSRECRSAMTVVDLLRWRCLLWAVAALLLAACGAAEAPDRSPEASPAVVAALPSATGTAGPSSVGSPVSFVTEDNVVVKGHLYGTGRTAVVFAHMFPNDQRAWAGFAAEVAGQGYSALTFDFRGFGETGGQKDVSRIDRDLVAAVRFLRERDYDRVVLVGASMGGTAALKVAARDDLSDVIGGVVAVSAAESFRGLVARDDVSRISVPVLFVASEGDDAAARSLESLFERAGDFGQRQLFSGSAHGTGLLEGEHTVEFKALVLDFLRAVSSP